MVVPSKLSVEPVYVAVYHASKFCVPVVVVLTYVIVLLSKVTSTGKVHAPVIGSTETAVSSTRSALVPIDWTILFPTVTGAVV